MIRVGTGVGVSVGGNQTIVAVIVGVMVAVSVGIMGVGSGVNPAHAEITPAPIIKSNTVIILFNGNNDNLRSFRPYRDHGDWETGQFFNKSNIGFSFIRQIFPEPDFRQISLPAF